jgi:hypothetical protein
LVSFTQSFALFEQYNIPSLVTQSFIWIISAIMRSSSAATLISLLVGVSVAAPWPVNEKLEVRDVDTRFPYTGPTIPVGDFVDPTVNGNGKGFPRLVEAPAVTPGSNPTNNVNVISLSYVPGGVNIHYQTPFGLGAAPIVKWGASPSKLSFTAAGTSTTYDRTPPCSLVVVTQVRSLPRLKPWLTTSVHNSSTMCSLLALIQARLITT